MARSAIQPASATPARGHTSFQAASLQDVTLTGLLHSDQSLGGSSSRKTAAGRATKTASSNSSVKSNERQATSMRGPKRSSPPGGQPRTMPMVTRECTLGAIGPGNLTSAVATR